MGTALSSSTVTWDFWTSVLALEDRLVLTTDTRSTANWSNLPRRGFSTPRSGTTSSPLQRRTCRCTRRRHSALDETGDQRTQ